MLNQKTITNIRFGDVKVNSNFYDGNVKFIKTAKNLANGDDGCVAIFLPDYLVYASNKTQIKPSGKKVKSKKV